MSSPLSLCPGCRAPMTFDPASGGLRCSYCATEQKVDVSGAAEVVEQPFDRFVGWHSLESGELAQGALEKNCPQCGAIVDFVPPETATICAFCGASMVTQEVAANPLIAPQGVLPFQIAKGQVAGLLQEWLGGLWFAPSGLSEMARSDKMQGIYVPYWTFDADTVSAYRGLRGEYYYETEYRQQLVNGESRQVAVQVRKTRWYSVSGAVENRFDDLLIPATQTIQKERLVEIAPWQLDKVEPYDPRFLAGFKAQRYQLELPKGFDAANQLMRPAIESRIRADISGDEQQISDYEVTHREVTFKHLLFPLWIAAYRFDSKVFQVIVNGQTGEVQGERPWSALKIAGLVIAILAVVILLALLNR